MDRDLNLPHRGVEGGISREGTIDQEGYHQAETDSVTLAVELSSGSAGVLASKEVAASKSNELPAESTACPLVPIRSGPSEVRSHGVLSEHHVSTSKKEQHSKAAAIEHVDKRRV